MVDPDNNISDFDHLNPHDAIKKFTMQTGANFNTPRLVSA